MLTCSRIRVRPQPPLPDQPAAFDEGDKDKSGSLDFDELKALLLKVGVEKDDLEVEEMLNAADKGMHTSRLPTGCLALCSGLTDLFACASCDASDGSGQVDFKEFNAVQQSIADAKAAEAKTWFDDPEKSQIRTNGCLDIDRKDLGNNMKWVDKNGSARIASIPLNSRARSKHLGTSLSCCTLPLLACAAEKHHGAASEKTMLKDCVEDQKEQDATAKDFAQVVHDASAATNLVMLHIRAVLIDSADIEITPAIVFSKMYALLADFAKEMGLKAGKGKPSIKTNTDFKLLFKGKNPITGFNLITADGKEVDFKSKKATKDSTMQFIYNTFFNLQHPENLCVSLSAHFLPRACVWRSRRPCGHGQTFALTAHLPLARRLTRAQLSLCHLHLCSPLPCAPCASDRTNQYQHLPDPRDESLFSD